MVVQILNEYDLICGEFEVSGNEKEAEQAGKDHCDRYKESFPDSNFHYNIF